MPLEVSTATMSNANRKLVLAGSANTLPGAPAGPPLASWPVGSPERAEPGGSIVTGPRGPSGPLPSHRREVLLGSRICSVDGPRAPPPSGRAGADQASAAADLGRPYGARGDAL